MTMTPDELEALAPELFEIARVLRDKHGAGAVRLRCIRVGVDEDGRGGEIAAGKVPAPDPGITVDYPMRPRVVEDDAPATPYRGRQR